MITITAESLIQRYRDIMSLHNLLRLNHIGIFEKLGRNIVHREQGAYFLYTLR